MSYMDRAIEAVKWLRSKTLLHIENAAGYDKPEGVWSVYWSEVRPTIPLSVHNELIQINHEQMIDLAKSRGYEEPA